MGIASWSAGRWRSVASVTAVAVAASAVAVLAITSEGYSATSVEINDGGVWVVLPGQVGRLNTQLDMLDAATPKGAQTATVLQEGADVFLMNPDHSVYRLAPATMRLSSPLQLQAGYHFDARGGTAVVWDEATGRAWVRPTSEILGLDLEAVADKPDAEAGPGAVATVDVTGAVHVLSVEEDEVTTIPAPQPGVESETVTQSLGRDVTEVSMTTVGGTAVVLDSESGQVLVPGQQGVAVEAASNPVLQQPGPAAAGVLVGMDRALMEIPLAGGVPVTVATVPSSGAAAPVRVGSRAIGAWNSRPWVVVASGGAVTENKAVTGLSSTANLTLRVNRSNVALNDLSGKLFVIDDTIRPADDNWDDVEPTEQETDETTPDDSTIEDSRELDRSGPNRPPKAENDRYGARAGQGSIFRILVNDTDPDGDVLVISDVDDVPESVGRLEVIDGGLAVQFTPSPTAGGTTATFRYTIDDGRGKSDAATVTVDIPATGAANKAPQAVQGRLAATIVETGRTVTYNVMDDWRDPDGDPLQLSFAESSDPTDTVRFNPDGTLTITAGPQPGKRTIGVTLTDGEDSATGKLALQVSPAGPLEPSARPDHYATTVNEPIVLTPLRNDNDPNGDDPGLISVEKPNQPGLQLIEDLNAGTIRFTASEPGSYTFLYEISGGTKPVPGVIRVDVRERKKNAPPVAVLDVVTLGSDLTAMTDVVANDTDQDGDVLVVTSVSDAAGMTVAVREHRVLEITAAKIPAKDVLLTYEVTDGKTTPVQGSVVVRRPVFGDGQNQPPNANPDRAVVRAGDVVTVPVLDNDTDADGDPLSLMPEITGLEADSGLAFVSGNTIRFQAPKKAGSVKLIYSVTDGKDTSSSRVAINVRAMEPDANQPPVPRPVTSRVVSGADMRVTIPIPLDGIDPDGDSVHLVGLDEPSAELGRVELVDGRMVYTPREGASGTDSFGYKVADSFGAQATGLVRVGVVPETGANQPPTPVDDYLEATPGKTVSVDVLANDSDPDGQQPSLYAGTDYPTIEAQPGVSAKVVGSRIQVKVPADGKTAGLAYWVQDGSGGVASATLTVVGSATVTNLPPIARDDIVPEPEAGQTKAEIDVLANDEDPDGTRAGLTVVRTIPEDAGTVSADGESVSVTLADRPQAIAYEVTDGQDSALAFVFVPALAADQPPALIPGRSVQATAGGTPVTVDLADYVADPEGRPVLLGAVDKVRGDSLGEARASGPAQVTYTPAAKGSGDGTITVEVIDGPTIQDSPNVVLLTIPVEVAPGANSAPTVRGGKLTVAAGEPAGRLDLAGLVTDDPGDTHEFGDLVVQSQGIDADLDGSVLSASAGADVARGATATATYTVTDQDGEKAQGTVTIKVVGSTRPLAKLATKKVDEANAGQAVTIAVADQTAFNPFPETPLTVVSAQVSSGDARVTYDAGTVTVTPAETFHGQAAVLYRVQDKTGDPDREVEGRIVLNVQSVPDKPAAPTKVSTGDKVVTIAWVTPPANGAAITNYKVTWQGGEQDCGTATECQIVGLTNGQTYRFSVTAINKVGPSPASDLSEAMKPDVAPSDPPTPSVTRPAEKDGRVLQVTWGAFTNKGTPISTCTLSNGLEERQVPCTADGSGQTRWDGLTNGQGYEFRIKAANEAGESDYSAPSDRSVGVPAGFPLRPGAPTAAVAGGEAGGKQVKVDWSPPDANGANLTGYSLKIYRGGGLEKSVDFAADVTSTTVDVEQNGANYTFAIVATNAVGSSDEGDQSAPVVPFGPPFAVASVQAVDGDQSAVLNFAAPGDNGKAIVRFEAQSSAGGTMEITPGGSFTGLSNGTAYTFQVRACNDFCGPWSPASNQVVPFGPPGQASVSASVVNNTTVRVSWNAPAPNGRDIANTVVTINGNQSTEAPSGSRDVSVSPGGTATIVARSCDSTGVCGPDGAPASATTPAPPPPTVSVYNDRGYYGISVSNWPHDGLIGCYIGAPLNNWQRNINVVNGSGSNSSQIGTGTTWYYLGPATVDCEGVQGTG